MKETLPLFPGSPPVERAPARFETKEEALDALEKARGEALAMARSVADQLILSDGYCTKRDVWEVMERMFPQFMQELNDLGIDRRWTGAIFAPRRYVTTTTIPRVSRNRPGEAHSGGYLQLWTYAEGGSQ
jgi:hypothetical protein